PPRWCRRRADNEPGGRDPPEPGRAQKGGGDGRGGTGAGAGREMIPSICLQSSADRVASWDSRQPVYRGSTRLRDRPSDRLMTTPPARRSTIARTSHLPCPIPRFASAFLLNAEPIWST